jgi:hypothetical protein
MGVAVPTGEGETQAMGTISGWIGNVFGAGGDGERPALKSWKAIAESGEVTKLLTSGVERLTPLLGIWQKAAKHQFEALKDGAIEALQPVFSSWEAVSRSEEFEALKTNAREGLQPVIGSFKAISKSEEFSKLITSATEGVQPALKSWKAVAKSEDFEAFKKSLKSLGGDMVSGALKQAEGSFVQDVADRAGKVLGGRRSRAAG